jgi:hypothetical protein
MRSSLRPGTARSPPGSRGSPGGGAPSPGPSRGEQHDRPDDHGDVEERQEPRERRVDSTARDRGEQGDPGDGRDRRHEDGAVGRGGHPPRERRVGPGDPALRAPRLPDQPPDRLPTGCVSRPTPGLNEPRVVVRSATPSPRRAKRSRRPASAVTSHPKVVPSSSSPQSPQARSPVPEPSASRGADRERSLGTPPRHPAKGHIWDSPRP